MATYHPSDPDTEIAMCAAVGEKWLDLSRDMERKTGGAVEIPVDMAEDIDRFMALRLRHDKGDFRHTEPEKMSMRAVAQWILDMNQDLVGMPRKQLAWPD